MRRELLVGWGCWRVPSRGSVGLGRVVSGAGLGWVSLGGAEVSGSAVGFGFVFGQGRTTTCLETVSRAEAWFCSKGGTSTPRRLD